MNTAWQGLVANCRPLWLHSHGRGSHASQGNSTKRSNGPAPEGVINPSLDEDTSWSRMVDLSTLELSDLTLMQKLGRSAVPGSLYILS